MPYATYRADLLRALHALNKPGQSWLKAAEKLRKSPFELMGPTTVFIIHLYLFIGKALFFTMKKVLDR